MARIPMVTRTVATTKVKFLCIDVEKQIPVLEEKILSGTFKNDAEILQYARKNFETDSMRYAHVKETEIVGNLYGMTEQKFIENAEILPPRKNNDSADENDISDDSEPVENIENN